MEEDKIRKVLLEITMDGKRQNEKMLKEQNVEDKNIEN